MLNAEIQQLESKGIKLSVCAKCCEPKVIIQLVPSESGIGEEIHS